MTDLALDLGLPPGPLTGERAFAEVRRGLLEGVLGSEERPWARAADRLISWMAGLSDAVENKVLDHLFNDSAYSAPTPYLALGTGAISDSDVAASFGGTTEANYTGYLRVAIPGATMGAASAGAKASSGAAIVFPDCTASSSTVIAWAVVSSGTARLTAGDVIIYGTCPSTTISTTATPPTIPAGQLSTTAD